MDHDLHACSGKATGCSCTHVCNCPHRGAMHGSYGCMHACTLSEFNPLTIGHCREST